jgi:hypothetical protein
MRSRLATSLLLIGLLASIPFFRTATVHGAANAPAPTWNKQAAAH